MDLRRDAIERALRIAESGGADQALRRELDAERARDVTWDEERRVEAGRLAAAIIASAGTSELAARARALDVLGRLRSWWSQDGPHDDAEHLLTESTRLARQVGQPAWAARALVPLAMGLLSVRSSRWMISRADTPPAAAASAGTPAASAGKTAPPAPAASALAVRFCPAPKGNQTYATHRTRPLRWSRQASSWRAASGPGQLGKLLVRGKLDAAAWRASYRLGVAHTYPPLNVEVRPPRLTLAGASDELLERLVPLVRAGVAVAEPWPFDDPMSFYADSPEREWQWLRGTWAGRARVSPDSWRLYFAVLVDGEPVGMQDLIGKNFTRFGTVSSFSWLAPGSRGQGLGKEMRAAILHLAFAGLGAREAGSDAFVDNEASNRVSSAGRPAATARNYQRRPGLPGADPPRWQPGRLPSRPRDGREHRHQKRARQTRRLHVAAGPFGDLAQHGGDHCRRTPVRHKSPVQPARRNRQVRLPHHRLLLGLPCA